MRNMGIWTEAWGGHGLADISKSIRLSNRNKGIWKKARGGHGDEPYVICVEEHKHEEYGDVDRGMRRHEDKL